MIAHPFETDAMRFLQDCVEAVNPGWVREDCPDMSWQVDEARGVHLDVSRLNPAFELDDIGLWPPVRRP